jgi:choline kinase
MKLIILAAGQGTRLRPLTLEKPKCMVQYQSKPIINYILETAKICNIDNISIICGYKKDILKSHLSDYKIDFFDNDNFDSTNMVSTLFCAEEFMDDDIIISYSDIIYKKEVLKKLIISEGNFNVVIDKNWKELWKLRMDNPLNDAETLKIENNKIIEIGKKPKNFSEIQGQYIGLIKISKKFVSDFVKFYKSLDRSLIYDGKDFHNIYMTSLIQLMINKLIHVSPVYISGQWIEIDSLEDLEAYKNKGIKF